MGTKQFRKVVKRLNRYIFSYGSRRFNSGSELPYNSKSSEHRKRFIRYCNDGYKKAHALILENMLALEKEHRVLGQISAPQTALDKNLHQRLVLRDFANSLAWIIAGHDESLARSWCSDAVAEGYLVDKNLPSEMRVVDYVNANPDSFAILADLTSCVNLGDVLATGPNFRLLLELKEGELNQEIVDALGTSDDSAKGEAEFKEKYKGEPGKLRQYERVKRQHGRLELSETYIKHKNKRFDLALGIEVSIQEDDAQGEFYLSDINLVCDRAREKGFAATIIDGCLSIIAVKRPISSTRIWDASHELYHLEDHELEKCNERGDGFSLEEFKLYSKFEYDFINQHFGIAGYLPTTSGIIYLGERTAKDIATGEIAVGVMLDVARFMELAKTDGVELQEVRARGSDKVSNARYIHNGKVLQTPSGAILGRGIFDKIIYEFETPRHALYKIEKLDKRAAELITKHQAASSSGK